MTGKTTMQGDCPACRRGRDNRVARAEQPPLRQRRKTAARGAGDRGARLSPVADGAAPMHIGLESAIGIVLKKQVKAPIPLNHAVRVVHPVGGRQEVVGRSAEVAGVGRGHGGHLDPGQEFGSFL